MQVFRSRRMAVLFVLGLASGLPYLLTGTTLQAWMTSAHVDLGRIAHLALIGLAYNLKLLWAPLLDRFRLPLLGRRRGWVLVFQLALIAAIAIMGAIDPVAQPEALAALAAAVAFLSASQDIVLDAYAKDILAPHERAAGSALYVLGYRVGMFIAGSLALVLAKRMPWHVVYAAMAAVLALGVVATLVAEEPAEPAGAPRSLRASYVEPIADLWRRLGRTRFARLVAFAALYELGYFFAQGMMGAFLLRDPGGFDFDEVAFVNKGMVLTGVAIGGIAGGAWVARVGARRALVPFAALAAATHLLYALLALAGHNIAVLCGAVLADSIADAMVSSVFVTVLYATSAPAFGAAQLAFLTSITSLGQRVLGPFADRLIGLVGWPGFFVTAAILAIPGIFAARAIARDGFFAPGADPD